MLSELPKPLLSSAERLGRERAPSLGRERAPSLGRERAPSLDQEQRERSGSGSLAGGPRTSSGGLNRRTPDPKVCCFWDGLAFERWWWGWGWWGVFVLPDMHAFVICTPQPHTRSLLPCFGFLPLMLQGGGGAGEEGAVGAVGVRLTCGRRLGAISSRPSEACHSGFSPCRPSGRLGGLGGRLEVSARIYVRVLPVGSWSLERLGHAHVLLGPLLSHTLH